MPFMDVNMVHGEVMVVEAACGEKEREKEWKEQPMVKTGWYSESDWS